MNVLQQSPRKELRCGRASAAHCLGSLLRLDRRYITEVALEMRPSVRAWRLPDSRQARCRCYAARVLTLAHANILKTRPHMVNVSFKVEYKCSFGQSITLVGDVASLGSWSSSRGLRMKWCRGDFWTCDVMVPAGSALECKYVIIDDAGQVVRWQEGINMVIKVPYSSQGLPVEKYDAEVSWCQKFATFTAHPLTTAAAAAAVAAAAASSTTSQRAVAASKAAPAAGAAASASPVAAASVVPVAAWARAKGSSAPPPAATVPISSLARPPAASSAHLDTTQPQPITESTAAAVAPLLGHPPHPARQPQEQRQPPNQTTVSPVAPVESKPCSLVKTLMQAATQVMGHSSPQLSVSLPSALPTPAHCASVRGASPAAVPAAIAAATATAPSPPSSQLTPSPPSFQLTPSPPSFQLTPSPPSLQLTPSFQLTPASEEEPMSLVLPSRRASSPPVKISLSSNFSKLMEMPVVAARTATCSGAPTSTGGPGLDSCSSTSSSGGASQIKATAATIQSHPIDLSTDYAGSNSSTNRTAPSGNGSTVVTGGSSSSGSSQSPSGAGRRVSSSPSTFLSPVWGMEYDVYAAAYGIPYMHTPFDLNAYAVYDQTSTEPVSAPRPTDVTSGLEGLVSKAMSAGADLLESAVQAARGSKVLTSDDSAGTATMPTSSPVAPQLLSSDLLTATAASTALALAAVAPAATATVATAPLPAVGTTAPSRTATAAVQTVPAAAGSSTPGPMSSSYRQVSRSSSSVSDWASRTLIELSSGRSMAEEDSDDEETADDDAVVAAALASPTAPGDMTALLQQLGTALGRSVRMRIEGIEPASVDLLELDRKIALAASKLYRQRDSLLTGWVRKETRRQLAAAATAAARAPANIVTPM